MASFLSRFFGGTSSAPEAASSKRDEPVAYKGFLIHAAPEQQDGQWRVAAVISKAGPEGEMERILQRADSFATREDAAAFAVTKGKQVIDQRGEDLFADGAASGRA